MQADPKYLHPQGFVLRSTQRSEYMIWRSSGGMFCKQTVQKEQK